MGMKKRGAKVDNNYALREVGLLETLCFKYPVKAEDIRWPFKSRYHYYVNSTYTYANIIGLRY